MEAESGWQIYWIQESNKTKHAGELLSGLTIGGLVALMKLHNISIRKNDSGIKVEAEHVCINAFSSLFLLTWRL